MVTVGATGGSPLHRGSHPEFYRQSPPNGSGTNIIFTPINTDPICKTTIPQPTQSEEEPLDQLDTLRTSCITAKKNSGLRIRQTGVDFSVIAGEEKLQDIPEQQRHGRKKLQRRSNVTIRRIGVQNL